MFIDNPRVICFDVDGTLILWDQVSCNEGYTVDIDGRIFIVNSKVVSALKNHAFQKHFIIVWSAAGAEWAQKVVSALELHREVNVIISKPMLAYDDLHMDEWMRHVDVTQFT